MLLTEESNGGTTTELEIPFLIRPDGEPGSGVMRVEDVANDARKEFLLSIARIVESTFRVHLVNLLTEYRERVEAQTGATMDMGKYVDHQVERFRGLIQSDVAKLLDEEQIENPIDVAEQIAAEYTRHVEGNLLSILRKPKLEILKKWGKRLMGR